MYHHYNAEHASVEDRIAWTLCQIIDDDAPMRWTRYRFAAQCIAGNPKLMADLQTLALTKQKKDRSAADSPRQGMPGAGLGMCDDGT